MEEAQSEAVRLRLEQALETLKEAEALQEHNLWRGVITALTTRCFMPFWR